MVRIIQKRGRPVEKVGKGEEITDHRKVRLMPSLHKLVTVL